MSQVEMGTRILRLQLHRPFERAHRAVEIAALRQRDTQHVPAAVVVGVMREKPAIRAHTLLLLPGAMGAACAVVLSCFYWRKMWETHAREIAMAGWLAAVSPL